MTTNGPPPGGSPQVATQAGCRKNSAGSSNPIEDGPCGQADSGLSRHEAGFDRPIRRLRIRELFQRSFSQGYEALAKSIPKGPFRRVLAVADDFSALRQMLSSRASR
jgi:hypothetical protein